MKRRDVLRRLAAGSMLAGAGTAGERPAMAQAQAPVVPPAPRGLPPIRIKDIWECMRSEA